MDIKEYCDALGLQLVLTRHSNQEGRWSARLHTCEFKSHPLSASLESTHGNGITCRAAVADMVELIRGRVMVVNATSATDRREYRVPTDLSSDNV